MTSGGQADDSDGRAAGRAVPDAENYLDLSGIEDDDHGPHFDVVLRGYDRRQVDEHVSGLRRMVAQLRAQLAVRERRRESAPERETPVEPSPTAARQSVPAAGAPRDDDGAAEGDDDAYGAFNDRLRGILQAAEQEAQAVRSRAAETLLAEHAESRAALADLRSQRDAVVDELVRLRGWLDDIVSHPGRTPGAPPPVLSPGPPRGRPWTPPPGPPPGRPPGGPQPAVLYGAAPRPVATVEDGSQDDDPVTDESGADTAAGLEDSRSG